MYGEAAEAASALNSPLKHYSCNATCKFARGFELRRSAKGFVNMSNTDPAKQQFSPDPVEQEAEATPITVGNPMDAASLAIDQSHMEDFASVEDKSDDVKFGKPPRGVFFTVPAETTEQWKNRKFFYLLQIEGRDPYPPTTLRPVTPGGLPSSRHRSGRTDAAALNDAAQRAYDARSERLSKAYLSNRRVAEV
jgi:hypothetical protein